MNFISKHAKQTWSVIIALLVVLILLNAYFSRTTISELTNLQQEIRKSTKIIALIQELHVQLLIAESGQRGYLLTRDDVYITDYKASVEQVNQSLATLRSTVSSKSEQTTLIQQTSELIEKKLKEMGSTIRVAKAHDFSASLKIVNSDEGLELYQQLNQLFTSIKQNEAIISSGQISDLEKSAKESSRNVSISLFISVILVMGVFLLVRVNMRNQLLREKEIESQNHKLQLAVEERTKELSLFSDELTRSNRELEDFAFVASHDLQEPLRKIMTFGDRLDDNTLSDKQQDYLKRMRTAANRMSVLISDLLEFSRVNTRGKDFSVVDLNRVLNNCIDDLSVLIEESNTQMNIQALPAILADPTQMQQLFFNLVANAIKFSADEETPSVSLSVEKVTQPTEIELADLDEWYQFTLSDNGIGFDQSYAEKIFSPFQRLHSRSEYKGTGIGLAICRRIVERHNGVIKASGIVSHGATFTVILPANNRLTGLK